MVTLMIGQMHLQQVQAAIDVVHQAQPLHHQVHGSYPAAAHRGSTLGHLEVDVTGFEHRAGLVFPVLDFETTFDSLLAVAQDFGIGSIHSKWPFVGCCSLDNTCISPPIDGHFELVVQTARKIALDAGLERNKFHGDWNYVIKPHAKP